MKKYLGILGAAVVALTPPVLQLIDASFTQTAILAHQFAAEFLCAVALVQHVLHRRPRWNLAPDWYCLASLCFLFAEASFNTSFLAGSVESYSPKLAGAMCYTGTFAALAVGNFFQFSKRGAGYLPALATALLALAHLALQYFHILVPLGPVYFDRLPSSMLPNAYAYSAVSALVGAQCVVFSLRRGLAFEERAFLGSLLVLVVADFGARRQIVLYEFAQTDMWQSLWAMSIGTFAVVVTMGVWREKGPFRVLKRNLPLSKSPA